MHLFMPDTILFDRFQIKEMSNAAGQSIGYQAVDLKAPIDKPWLREVFVKQYHDLIPGSNEGHALDQHFQVLRTRLNNHENLISLPIGLGEAGNSIVAIYPWIQGLTLKDRMVDGLTHDESIRIALALIKAVRIIHKEQIAHLDLKASNVVVQNGKDGQIYIRLIDLDAARIDGVGLRHTVIGTNFYTSPEHHFPDRYGEVSVKSDIFTLGIMLFELLFKQHPFGEAAEYQVAITNDRIWVPKHTYPPEVVSRIIQCLAVEPGRRPTAGAVQSTFQANYEWLRRGLPGDVAPPPPPVPGPKRTYIQLEGQGLAHDFRRAYYSTVDLDMLQLRGALVGSVPSGFVRFALDDQGWSLSLLTDSIEVTLQGRRLQLGESVRIVGNERLQIGSVNFQLRAIPF